MFLIILKYVYWSERLWYVVSSPSPTFDSNVNISSSSGIFFRSSPALLSPKPEKKTNQFHFLFLTAKRHQVKKKSLHEPFHGLLIHVCPMESSPFFKLWLCCLNSVHTTEETQVCEWNFVISSFAKFGT